MKSLDLNAIGVCEMDTNEVMNIEGGIWWLIAGALLDVALTQDT